MSLPPLPGMPVTQHQYKNKWLKKGVTYRPYLVGEESILIQNKDTSDKDRLNAIRHIIGNCIDHEDIGSIPFFVIEHLFVQIRMQSAGKDMELRYRCSKEVDKAGDKVKCGGEIPVVVDLNDIYIREPEGFSNVVAMYTDPNGDDIGAKFDLPTIDLYESLGENEVSIQDMVLKCLSHIYHGDEVFDVSEYSDEQIVAWWNSFNSERKMKVIENCFSKMPHIYYKSSATCTKCGHEHEFEFKKLKHFFG